MVVRSRDAASPQNPPPPREGPLNSYLFYIAGDVRRVAGNARQMLSLARAVQKQGHRVAFVSQAWGPQSEFREVDAPLDTQGKDAHRLEPPFEITWLEPDIVTRRRLAVFFRLYHFRPFRPLIRHLYIAALRPAFDRVIEHLRPDVVVACSCSLIYFNETLEESARRNGALFSVVPMCHIEAGENTGARFVELYKRAGAVLASTQHEAKWLLSRQVPSSHVHVLGASADYVVADLAEADGGREVAPVAPAEVLFLGRKVRTKGYHLILSAMSAVWAEFPETRFVFVGPGEADWQADVAPYAADPRVLDIGAVDTERMTWLKRCTMLCVPSVAESFGLIYTEAWLFRKPVIAAHIAVTKETVGQTGGGLIVEADAASVAAAIISLLRDPTQAKEMGEQGWRATQGKYNWANIAMALDHIVEQVKTT